MPGRDEACCPRDEQRQERLTDLLKLVAQEDEKTIQLALGILAPVKKAAGSTGPRPVERR